MIGEPGPQHERHLPSYRDGCYYDRVEDCCWICYLRLIWRASEPDVQEANRAARARSTEGAEQGGSARSRLGEHPADRRRGEEPGVVDTTDDASTTVAELEPGEESRWTFGRRCRSTGKSTTAHERGRPRSPAVEDRPLRNDPDDSSGKPRPEPEP
jgi:hypothetical protein